MTQVPASPPFSANPIWLSPQRVGGRSAPPPATATWDALTTVPIGVRHTLPDRKNRLPPCFPRHSPGGKIRLGLRTAVENP